MQLNPDELIKGIVIVEGQVDFDYEITLLTVRAKNGIDGEVS